MDKFQELLSNIEEIKTDITDIQYFKLMESMKTLYDKKENNLYKFTMLVYKFDRESLNSVDDTCIDFQTSVITRIGELPDEDYSSMSNWLDREGKYSITHCNKLWDTLGFSNFRYQHIIIRTYNHGEDCDDEENCYECDKRDVQISIQEKVNIIKIEKL